MQQRSSPRQHNYCDLSLFLVCCFSACGVCSIWRKRRQVWIFYLGGSVVAPPALDSVGWVASLRLTLQLVGGINRCKERWL